MSEYALAPDQYLEQIQKIKRTVSLPVIGSLNGTSLSAWLEYAGLIEEAGADAVELNFYYVPTNPQESAAVVEHRLLETVRMVKQVATIPVAVKLSPFVTSLPHLACQLEELKVEGLVLFNRFYQPVRAVRGAGARGEPLLSAADVCGLAVQRLHDGARLNT